MRLFNTLTQQLETLQPTGPDGNEVTLYVCGITPYDTTHLGHAALNVVYDTLVRALRWEGLSVRYAQNVTDIDDDILRKAKEVGKPWDILGREETARYLADLRALNVEPPTYYVSATNEIPAMVELIEALVEKDLAYVRDGWVYYSVKSDPDFGKLAEAAGYHGYENWLQTANERGNNPNDPRKKDPLDFVLWQAQAPGEPAWPSPWGMGRPGWHIECSAMAVKYLGQSISIHGGGADLVFPHHTCEIAQSENGTGVCPFVQIWMHLAMVYMNGEKMSKSLGNLVRVNELLREYTPDAVRVMLLSHRYRVEWEYTEADMRESAERAGRMAASIMLITSTNNADVAAVGEDPIANQAREEFRAALDNDLDTPTALGVLERLAAQAETSGSYAQLITTLELAQVLGLKLQTQAESTAGAEALTGGSGQSGLLG